MNKVLVDTSALIILADRGDERHLSAVQCQRGLRNTRLYVTDYIMDEALTLLRVRGAGNAASHLIHEIQVDGSLELVFLGPDLFGKTVKKYQKMAGSTASFTDCSSFVVMDHLMIKLAFTFDEDFRRAGYTCVP